MTRKSFIPQVQTLRGPAPTPQRQVDAVNQALQQFSPIADSVATAGVTLQVPTSLPAQLMIQNPLGRIALGMICTLRNQPCTVELLSSTSTTATVVVNLVPLSKNGIITGLSKLTGTLVVSLLFY